MESKGYGGEEGGKKGSKMGVNGGSKEGSKESREGGLLDVCVWGWGGGWVE